MSENLIGFDSIASDLFNNYEQQKLHHAVLLQGKKGIGKSSFAKILAKKILQTDNNLHPDLLIIEKEPEKKEITVDKIRKIADFINQTSAISPNKFIIIDSACNLNKSASNALLKILEEPHANNFLILISHNLNQILPTIKSRCQIIKIPDLSKDDFKKILLNKNPIFNDIDLEFLSKICDNSPAEALETGKSLTRLYSLFLNSIKEQIIADDLLKIITDKNFIFRNFEKTFEFFVNRLVKFFTGVKIDFYFNEEEIFINLIKNFSLEESLLIIDQSSNLLNKTIALNLDKKLTIINIFNKFSIYKNV